MIDDNLLIIFPVLVLSAELISRGAEKIEKVMGQGMTGGIIMGLLTALPETVFVITASLRNEPYIALGSAIGGNVLLFTFGIGLLGVYNFIRWRKSLTIAEDYTVEHKFLIASTVALLFVLMYGSLNIYTSIPLIALYAYYAYYRVRKFVTEDKEEIEGKDIVKASLYLVVGAFLLILFSEPFVNDVARLSAYLHIPSIWLALVLTPLAGELEETITAIRLTYTSEKGGSLAIFDFVGSKIENATVLLAIVGIFNDVNLQLGMNEVVATLIANTFAIFILMDKNLGLKESIMLMIVYFLVAYLTLVF
ncbi:sodium:calcium antiporter [Stygiolobus caldivivus]|uniref:Sodium:calcium antiporter n=1 Tax=Stygiolobus caldivivus TaxID=2824673 RepID=A0A8D5U690_9CREN|nr:sodium:calcium antiporter [Stygiolobus caldivivus]BCU70375.1 sodium:calcium antiporter [Stygiolobus caldivivus]